MKTILAFFGYVKVPAEVIQLAIIIKNQADKEQPDMNRIKKAITALEQFLRSGRIISY